MEKALLGSAVSLEVQRLQQGRKLVLPKQEFGLSFLSQGLRSFRLLPRLGNSLTRVADKFDRPLQADTILRFGVPSQIFQNHQTVQAVVPGIRIVFHALPNRQAGEGFQTCRKS
jgi:hypothetical protein